MAAHVNTQSLAWLLFAFANRLVGLSSLPVERAYSGKAALKAIDQVSVNRVSRLSQPVMSELGCSRHFNESGFAQEGEMPRHQGLRERQNLDQIADAQFSGCEQVHYANAGWVCESAKEILDVNQVRASRPNRRTDLQLQRHTSNICGLPHTTITKGPMRWLQRTRGRGGLLTSTALTLLLLPTLYGWFEGANLSKPEVS